MAEFLTQEEIDTLLDIAEEGINSEFMTPNDVRLELLDKISKCINILHNSGDLDNISVFVVYSKILSLIEQDIVRYSLNIDDLRKIDMLLIENLTKIK